MINFVAFFIPYMIQFVQKMHIMKQKSCLHYFVVNNTNIF
jgi:hypothetical protein